MPTSNQHTSTTHIRFISYACAIATGFIVIMFGAMIVYAERLTQFGLVGHVWLAITWVFAFISSAVLFAAFKSYAKYSGDILGGKVTLGGPGALLVTLIAMGHQFAPTPNADFDFTVYLQFENSTLDTQHASDLQRRGELRLTLGADPRKSRVGADAEARFINIPASFIGQTVTVQWADSFPYQLASPHTEVTLTGEYAYIPVTIATTSIQGEISTHAFIDADTLRTSHTPQALTPVANVTVSVRTANKRYQATTDAQGYFSLSLPANLSDTERELLIFADGYQQQRIPFVFNSSPLRIALQRL